MLIIYGHNTQEIGNKRPKDIKCYNCGTVGQMNVSKHVTYVFVMVPLFPVNVFTVFQCIRCKATMEYSEMDANLKAYYKPYKIKKLPAIWNYSGLLIATAIVIGIWFSQLNDKEKIRKRLDAIEIDRVIDIKTPEGNFTTIKTIKASKEAIYFVYNTYEVDDYKDINSIDSDNYTNDTLIVNRSTLKEWIETNKIRSVHW